MCSSTDGGKDGGREDPPASFLVGDASLPGGQHVVEGVSANAGPGEEVNQKDSDKINNTVTCDEGLEHL